MAQHFGGLEAAVGAQVLRERPVDGAGDVAGRKPEDIIQQCGSGITANHNLLSMELAGLPGSRLYPPSWSGWISDPSRPVAKGE